MSPSSGTMPWYGCWPGILSLRVERDHEAAIAMRVDQLGQADVVRHHRVRRQLGGGAHAQFGIAFDHQQTHRTVAMDLHHDRAVELQVGRQQRGGRQHFAQQRAHRPPDSRARAWISRQVSEISTSSPRTGGVFENEFLEGV